MRTSDQRTVSEGFDPSIPVLNSMLRNLGHASLHESLLERGKMGIHYDHATEAADLDQESGTGEGHASEVHVYVWLHPDSTHREDACSLRSAGMLNYLLLSLESLHRKLAADAHMDLAETSCRKGGYLDRTGSYSASCWSPLDGEIRRNVVAARDMAPPDAQYAGKQCLKLVTSATALGWRGCSVLHHDAAEQTGGTRTLQSTFHTAQPLEASLRDCKRTMDSCQRDRITQ